MRILSFVVLAAISLCCFFLSGLHFLEGAFNFSLVFGSIALICGILAGLSISADALTTEKLNDTIIFVPTIVYRSDDIVTNTKSIGIGWLKWVVSLDYVTKG